MNLIFVKAGVRICSNISFRICMELLRVFVMSCVPDFFIYIYIYIYIYIMLLGFCIMVSWHLNV